MSSISFFVCSYNVHFSCYGSIYILCVLLVYRVSSNQKHIHCSTFLSVNKYFCGKKKRNCTNLSRKQCSVSEMNWYINKFVPQTVMNSSTAFYGRKAPSMFCCQHCLLLCICTQSKHHCSLSSSSIPLQIATLQISSEFSYDDWGFLLVFFRPTWEM